jgi:hypothetical protein
MQLCTPEIEMLRFLALCGMLTISYSFNIDKYDETTYEAILREQEFPEEDIKLFMQVISENSTDRFIYSI